MAKITRQGLRDLAYKEIHEMIENSRFTPGRRINVEELTKELGVSRTPVWQAIGLLEREGLLTYIPNVGVFMQEISPQEALDLYSVREALEILAAERAAEHISEIQLHEMKDNLEQQKLILQNNDFISYSRLDFQFHAIVYRAAQNNCLHEMLDDIKKKMRPMVDSLFPIMEELYKDHVEMLKALNERNGKKTGYWFRMHNERMKKLIVDETERTKIIGAS